MYKRILIATDGSPLSQKAVASGLALAAMTRARVIALKVVPRYPRNFFDGGLTLDVLEIKRIEEQWSAQAHELLAKVKKAGTEDGVMVKTIVAKSDLVAEAIIAAAKKHDCDLIVMASHGRKGVKRVLLGSETLNVLTHSEIPVLVLR
ncbi:universal stress protein [Comamonas badia]|uniref:universal stress protein n=1 Tax=Comamonas badia TaxID=265291 RepID=UPI000415DA80|nr:universal stress protein [Comamonas badia]